MDTGSSLLEPGCHGAPVGCRGGNPASRCHVPTWRLGRLEPDGESLLDLGYWVVMGIWGTPHIWRAETDP